MSIKMGSNKMFYPREEAYVRTLITFYISRMPLGTTWPWLGNVKIPSRKSKPFFSDSTTKDFKQNRTVSGKAWPFFFSSSSFVILSSCARTLLLEELFPVSAWGEFIADMFSATQREELLCGHRESLSVLQVSFSRGSGPTDSDTVPPARGTSLACFLHTTPAHCRFPSVSSFPCYFCRISLLIFRVSFALFPSVFAPIAN